MTAHAGLSDDRVDQILGPSIATQMEAVALAREVKASRAELHAVRNQLAPCVSALEIVRMLVVDGRMAAPDYVREILEERHRAATEMGGRQQ